MKRVYDVSVTLKSALHINGGTNADGTRMTIQSGGKAYIPATLFKGMVRENFQKLVSLMSENTEEPMFESIACTGRKNAEQPCGCPTCTMFGKAGFQRARIYFDNLETEQELNYSLRANVAIDRYLQKARDGALVFSQVVETKDKSKMPVTFSGQVLVYPSEKYGNEMLVCLEEAIKMIQIIGLGKSRGLGFVEVNIREAERQV